MQYELKDVLIRIEDIVVKYGDNLVLAGINAEVRDIVRPNCITGQVIGILGPSGVGKTQLSRVLTGLQKPTSGRVTVGADTKPIREGLVGFVPQNYLLSRHRTILDALMLAARKGGCPGDQAKDKAMAMLQRFGVQDKWDLYPVQLSGGQRQRIAIAEQLLCSEHYLVLDEPTTGLDPRMKDRVCDLIRQLAGMSEENTVFVVTHDVASILTVADHLWLIGRVKNEKGEPAGARIVETYDLIARGLAWQERPQDLPVYVDLQREIRNRFETL